MMLYRQNKLFEVEGFASPPGDEELEAEDLTMVKAPGCTAEYRYCGLRPEGARRMRGGENESESYRG
eukprot:scaffold1237_cov182-Ochromonas_danica.AAC.1